MFWKRTNPTSEVSAPTAVAELDPTVPAGPIALAQAELAVARERERAYRAEHGEPWSPHAPDLREVPERRQAGLDRLREAVRAAELRVQAEVQRARQTRTQSIRPRIRELEDRAQPHLAGLSEIAEAAVELLDELRSGGVSDADPVMGELRRFLRFR